MSGVLGELPAVCRGGWGAAPGLARLLDAEHVLRLHTLPNGFLRTRCPYKGGHTKRDTCYARAPLPMLRPLMSFMEGSVAVQR